MKASLSVHSAGEVREREAIRHGVPAHGLPHRAPRNGTSTKQTKPEDVLSAPVVPDRTHDGQQLRASAATHTDLSRAASAPDDRACLTAPQAERGCDQMPPATLTASCDMCMSPAVRNCVYLALDGAVLPNMKASRRICPRRCGHYWRRIRVTSVAFATWTRHLGAQGCVRVYVARAAA